MKKTFLLTILAALIFIIAASGAANAEIIRAQGVGQFGYEAVVLCESITVREGPGTNYRPVKKLPYGRRFSVTNRSGRWAECILSDDLYASPAGWVNTDYIAIDPAWYRTDAQTPVYAWKSTSAPKVALLNKGEMLPILKQETGWVVVSLRGAAGWIRVGSN